MEISQAKSSFGVLLIALLINACSGSELKNTNLTAWNANQNSSQTIETIAQDNVEELGKIIKLPFEPEEATYKEIDSNTKTGESRVPAPNEKRLVAVLKFSTENASKIAAQVANHQPPVPSDIDADTWFPPELIAKSQETGDEFLKGVEYGANDFLQPPYSSGKLTRINDTDYFVLELK